MSNLRPLALSLMLALLASLPALAQEESSDPAPAGITMLLLLAGVGAVSLIGFVINTRENNSPDAS